jgi:ubiquinone/menaquinone biosynthesis C-methylase UbiE
MEQAELIGFLHDLRSRNKGRDFFSDLCERKKSELEFHNACRDKKEVADLPHDTYELLHGNKKYYTTVERSRLYVENWLRSHVSGKVFLDYACGNGEQAIKAAQFGSSMSIGLDISDVSVGNAQAASREAGVAERCFFVQGDCENTGLPDESVDVVLCSGMLHHLDLSYAFPELRRILKKGGVILGVEALDYNPAIKLYRTLTPQMRTDWEKNHILSFKDIRFARRFFEIGGSPVLAPLLYSGCRPPASAVTDVPGQT